MESDAHSRHLNAATAAGELMVYFHRLLSSEMKTQRSNSGPLGRALAFREASFQIDL